MAIVIIRSRSCPNDCTNQQRDNAESAEFSPDRSTQQFTIGRHCYDGICYSIDIRWGNWVATSRRRISYSTVDGSGRSNNSSNGVSINAIEHLRISKKQANISEHRQLIRCELQRQQYDFKLLRSYCEPGAATWWFRSGPSNKSAPAGCRKTYEPVESSSKLRKKGFRGDGRVAGMTAMALSHPLLGGLAACGGPRPRSLG